MYNETIEGVTGYHRKRSKIAEIQEFKTINVSLQKSKPVIISRYPVSKVKLNDDLGLIAFTTNNHQICLYLTSNSERLETLQEVQGNSSEKTGPTSPINQGSLPGTG